jgi:hypothetical protein
MRATLRWISAAPARELRPGGSEAGAQGADGWTDAALFACCGTAEARALWPQPLRRNVARGPPGRRNVGKQYAVTGELSGVSSLKVRWYSHLALLDRGIQVHGAVENIRPSSTRP